MAEDAVSRAYLDTGHEALAERWRGAAGEIDLIFRGKDEVIFVEVKKAATHDLAARRLGRLQIGRITLAAQEFCADLPAGLMTPMRFDLALVDRFGRVEILENAFGAV
nr:YraN family protein [Paracoccus ravus]